MIIEFEAELWLWQARSDAWTFVTVPGEESELIAEAVSPYDGRGFGAVRVEVSVGATVWRTSIFPDKQSGCYVLPIKAKVRRAEGLDVGRPAQVHLRVVDL